MKKFLFLLALYIPNCTATNPRLKTIKIYPDSHLLDTLGYGNCDGETNGEFNLIQHVLQTNDMVFDIGAHVGDWSKLILKTNPHVTIHAFEPIPASFKTLQDNNTYPNVFLHNIAMSKEVCFEDFLVYVGNSGLTDCSSLYYRPIIADYLTEKITVLTSNLDTFCKEQGINHIDFLKIDTEGAEWAIFLGAKELLNNQAISLIQFEYGGCNIDSKTTLQQMYELLTSQGYTIFRIVEDGLIHINEWRPALETYTYSNYLAVLDHETTNKSIVGSIAAQISTLLSYVY